MNEEDKSFANEYLHMQEKSSARVEENSRREGEGTGKLNLMFF